MKILRFLLIFGMAAALGPSASAHDSQAAEKRVLLQRQDLRDAAGKQGIMATVHYAPGQASAPHEHPGSVFAYVLEGAVVSQLEGSTPVTYKAGDSWYEAPHAGHLVSRNASDSKPATLLVFLLTDQGASLSTPR